MCGGTARAFLALLIFTLGSLTQTNASPDETLSANETPPPEWKLYHGNFFEIGVPPNFVERPEGKLVGDNRSDGVSLWNESQGVEFYVFSPQWNGVSPWTKTKTAETLDSHESKTTGDVVEEQWTMTAKNKSYVRFVVSLTNTTLNTNRTFGIRIPNMKVYAKVKPTYVQWKRTLQQFAD